MNEWTWPRTTKHIACVNGLSAMRGYANINSCIIVWHFDSRIRVVILIHILYIHNAHVRCAVLWRPFSVLYLLVLFLLVSAQKIVQIFAPNKQTNRQTRVSHINSVKQCIKHSILKPFFSSSVSLWSVCFCVCCVGFDDFSLARVSEFSASWLFH